MRSRDRRPEGREDEHLVARVDDRLKAPKQPLHPTVEDEHILLACRDAVALAQFRGDGRAQLGDAGGRGVARAVLGERARHGLLDGLGSVEEGLATLELVDGGPLRTQPHHLVADFDDVGKPDLLKSPRQAED